MLLDVRLGGALREVGAVARAAEAMGFHGAWTSETQHDALLPIALAAGATRRLTLGTSIAVAFPRSPVITAHLAWDLQELSGGRFILGLGSQVKGHIERRYGLAWAPPGPRLREYIAALRAIWDCWQHGTPLAYRGELYSHTLMPPFFSPGPIAHPAIPVHIAGVQEYMCRLAGECADGLHVHPFHSPRYLKEVVLPNLEQGLHGSGRSREAFALVGSVLVATGTTSAELEAAREEARRQIAFYASTPNYRIVLECHGWGGAARDLTRQSIRGDWDGMAAGVSDQMLETFAVVGPPAELPDRLRERYAGLLDRLAIYQPFHPAGSLSAQRALLTAFPPPASPESEEG